MTDQVHIRDAETVRLLRDAARQTGRTMSDILRAAVRAYEPGGRMPGGIQRADAAKLLAEDRRNLVTPASALDDLYDKDGLPR